MTDKQIDINNQVEVGLNIAKELLELHKMFEDEVEKSPDFIQTNFIKNKLFYFYQRADWLNVCFNLLDKQLQAKEQECEELKGKLTKSIFEDGTKQIALDIAIYERDKLKQTLTEIKEIAEICKCHNTDGCYECKYFDDCEVEDEEIPTRDVCKLILQKISEVIDEK